MIVDCTDKIDAFAHEHAPELSSPGSIFEKKKLFSYRTSKYQSLLM